MKKQSFENSVISEELGEELKKRIQKQKEEFSFSPKELNALLGKKKEMEQSEWVEGLEKIRRKEREDEDNRQEQLEWVEGLEKIGRKERKDEDNRNEGRSEEPKKVDDKSVDNKGEKFKKIDISKKEFNKILQEIFDEYKEQYKAKELSEQQYNYCRDFLNDFDETFGKENSEFKELEQKIRTKLNEEKEKTRKQGYDLDLFKQIIKEALEKKTEEMPKKREEKNNKDYSKENFELLFKVFSKELSEKYKYRHQYKNTDRDKYNSIGEEFEVQQESLLILFQNLGTNNPFFKKYEDRISDKINEDRGLDAVKQVVKKIIEELSKTRESAKNTRKAEDIEEYLRMQYLENLKEQYENGLNNLRTESLMEEKIEEKTEEEKSVIKSKLVGFNIKLENLEQIDGFKDLTTGQVLLILENLKQITFSNIKEKASKNYKEEMSQLSQGGFLKKLIKTPEKIWKSMTKKYQIAKEEKVEILENKKGGIEIYKKDLEQLIRGVNENKLDVIEKEGGQFEIQYININDEKLNSEQKKEAENFNKVATEFSKVPYEWSQETATKEQQQKFLNAEYGYQKAKITILNIESNVKTSKAETALYMNDIDRKVFYNQFLNAHPEIEKEFKKMTDSNALLAIKSVFNNSVAKHGGFLAFGFGVRCYTISLIGLFGAPFVAAGIGGILARKRAKETLKEAELEGRRGEKSKKEEAKNFIDADKATEKIYKLIDRISGEQDESKTKSLINSLKTRIEYIEDKLDNGLVNSGDKDSRLKNQLELIQALSKAEVITVDNIEGKKTKLKERLDKFLDIRGGKIEQAEKKYVRNQTIKGALMGAGFAVAGYGLRHFAGHWFGWDKNIADFKNVSVGHENQSTKPDISHQTNVGGNNQADLAGAHQDVATTAPAVALIAENIQTPLAEQIDKLATVQKGEGAWHAISRQLNDLMKNNPEKFAKQFNLKPEDFDTSAEQEAIINKETWKFLVDNKIINPDNQTEIRIIDPGTRVILDLENHKVNIIDQSGAQAGKYTTVLGAHETVAHETVVTHGASIHETTGGHVGGGHDIITPKTALSPEVSQTEPLFDKINKSTDGLIEWDGKGVMQLETEDINYSNSHGLGLMAVDENKDGIADKIVIFDKHNKIIEILSPLKDQTPESFIETAKVEATRFIGDRTLAFEGIVKNSGITIEDAKVANINIFEGHELSFDTQAKLDFWSTHIDALPKPEIVKDFFELSRDSMVNYNSPKFLHVFENMPRGLNADQEVGYVEIFAGSKEQQIKGCIKLFGEEMLGAHTHSDDFIMNEKTGVFTIKNAWGNKGANIVLTDGKIGIQRAGLLTNWGTKGAFGNIRPTEDLTPEMIGTVKTKIEIFAKNYAENQFTNPKL